MIHIGDNIESDYGRAKKHGIDARYYPNVSFPYGEQNLPYGMSRLVGAFSKGLINGYLNNGINKVSPYFEYGMQCGGLLTCGYCQFLNDVSEKQGIDKILFVARDGYIMKKVYDTFYGKYPSEYILFSRFCSEQILFERYTQDYILHNFYYRLDLKKKVPLEQLFHEIDLDFLTDKLPRYGLNGKELYTSRNSDRVVAVIYAEKEDIAAHFRTTQESMYEYLAPMIRGCKKVLVVDLGWFGTGGLAIKYLLEEKYKLEMKVVSALVGTNEDLSMEGRIAGGELYPYAFSPVHDLWILHWHARHQCNVHNLLIELLFSAPVPSFLKFSRDENGELAAQFGYEEKENYGVIEDIHSGILKFAELYNGLDEDIKRMLVVNGGDAYAAFMCTADNVQKCYELFKDYKINSLSGIFGSKAMTTLGEIMAEDQYI